MEARKRDYRPMALWAAILVLGAALLSLNITHESLWYDESYTGSLVKQGFADIIRITANDSHPPLYYLMLRVICLVFGNTVFTLRFFSVLGVVALAALGIGPVKRAAGINTGLLFAVLLFCFPVTHFMGQEARMYTWAAFFVTGSALYGYLALRDEKNADYVKFAFFSMAAMYTHYYALLAVAVLCALMLLFVLLERKKARPLLLAMGALLLGYAPWMVALVSQVSRVSEHFWIPPVTNQVIWQTLIYPFGSKFFGLASPNYAEATFYIAMGLIAFGILQRLREKDGSVRLVLFAMGTFFITILGGVVASRLIRPVLVERYMVPLMGLLALCIAYALAGFEKKRYMYIACAIIAGLSLLQILAIHTERVNGPMTEAVAYLQERIEPDDVFLHTDEHTLGTFSYYFADHKNYYYQRGGYEGYSNYDAFRPNGMTITDIAQVEGSPRVWLLQRRGAADYYQSMAEWQRKGQLNAAGMKEFRLPASWYAFTIYRATLPGREEKSTPAQTGAGAPGQQAQTGGADPRDVSTLTIHARLFKGRQGAAIAHLFNKGQMMILPGMKHMSAPITDGGAEFQFVDIPYGEYAVFVFHDENGNGEPDMEGGGCLEGFGITSNGKVFAGPPGFEESKFELFKDMAVDVDVHYYK